MNKEIQKLYLEGANCVEISNKLNINYGLVQKFVKENKLRIQRENLLLDKIISLLNTNKTIKEISLELQISKNTIYNILNKKNIQKQKKRHFQKIDETKEKEIIELLKTSSLTLSEISSKYSISRQRVFSIQKSKNINRKN